MEFIVPRSKGVAFHEWRFYDMENVPSVIIRSYSNHTYRLFTLRLDSKFSGRPCKKKDLMTLLKVSEKIGFEKTDRGLSCTIYQLKYNEVSYHDVSRVKS